MSKTDDGTYHIYTILLMTIYQFTNLNLYLKTVVFRFVY